MIDNYINMKEWDVITYAFNTCNTGLVAVSTNRSNMVRSSYSKTVTESGVGVTKPIFSVPLFSTFPLLSKQTLAIEYRVHIWQVSPQLSCGDTCQIWMWFGESNRYFCKIENFAYGEISERSFSNPQPRCSYNAVQYNTTLHTAQI